MTIKEFLLEPYTQDEANYFAEKEFYLMVINLECSHYKKSFLFYFFSHDLKGDLILELEELI